MLSQHDVFDGVERNASVFTCVDLDGVRNVDACEIEVHANPCRLTVDAAATAAATTVKAAATAAATAESIQSGTWDFFPLFEFRSRIAIGLCLFSAFGACYGHLALRSD